MKPHVEVEADAQNKYEGQEKMSGKKRVDPYRNFKFRLSWNGRIVAGFSESTGFDAISTCALAAENRKTARGRKLTGLRKYPAITLKRGVTHDAEFANWVRNSRSSHAELSITIVDELGQPRATHKIPNAWASEFQAMPDLDANANAIAIQTLKLENEGFEREEELECRGKFYGVYRGVVINNIDPVGRGRIQVQVPTILDGAAVGWAMPCVPVNLSSNVGSALPRVGAGVWIQFEAGDVNRPVWTGCFWNGTEVPPAVRNPL